MSVTIQTETPPLRRDDTGAIRVGNSRVLLESVISAFLDGETPEAIVQGYSTASLADVYSVIGYYLHHREEIDEYLSERERVAEEVRHRINDHQGDLSELRQRLLRQRDS